MENEDRRKPVVDREPPWSKDARRNVAVAVVCMFIALGALAFAVTLVKNIVEGLESRQQRVANCLLEQLTEHRLDSRYHNEREAEVGEYIYPNPDGRVAPPPIAVDLEVCKEFTTKEVNTR